MAGKLKSMLLLGTKEGLSVTVPAKQAKAWVEEGPWEVLGKTVRIGGQADAIQALKQGWSVTIWTGNIFHDTRMIPADTKPTEAREIIRKYRDRFRYYGSLVWHAVPISIE